MKYSKIIVTVTAVIALGGIIYFLSSNGISSGNPSETVLESPADEAPEKTVKEVPINEPAKTQELEIADNSDMLEKIHEILLSASEYYNDTANNTTVLTQNGFLYYDSTDTVITPDYLVKREYLLPDYVVNGALILYLNPEEVSETIPFEDYSNKLKLYVAAPYEGGYIVDTKNYNAVKISNDDFGKIIAPYNIKHGNLRRVTGSTDDYAGINAAIREYEDTDVDFYIRYAMRDDKYAVVIASSKDKYDTIRQYVFAFEDGEWQIRVPNLESVTKTKVIVNNVCRDLDAALMPDYDVKDYAGLMIKDFSGVTSTLVSDGYLEEGETQLKYISSTDKFMFAKYENNRMFIGINTGEIWVLGEVSSPEDALAQFKAIDERAPDFVIIWE